MLIVKLEKNNILKVLKSFHQRSIRCLILIISTFITLSDFNIQEDENFNTHSFLVIPSTFNMSNASYMKITLKFMS